MQAELQGGSVVGTVQMIPLQSVHPNNWNPNRMTPRQVESLRYGLSHDGWLASQSMLIWRTDENGEEKNLIIDGEHRWEVAGDLGFRVGPAVFLDGITEAQAKALTIKLDNKRGQFDETMLGALLRDIRLDAGPDMAVDLGFEDTALAALLEPPAPPPPRAPAMPTLTDQVHMVQILFTAEQKAEWDDAVRALATRYGTLNVTDTVLAAVRAVGR